MSYSVINQICFYSCIGSIMAGTALGILAVWVPNLWRSDFTPKGLLTTGILFAASALGALVTKLLLVH